MGMAREEQARQYPFTHLNHLTLTDAALAYATAGIRVFPLQANSKLPMRGWSWKRMATTDPDTIRDWWRLWPQANIGLALGEGSGLDALDIDCKNGQDGVRSYQAITQDAYRGPVQQTPTGGQHLLFQYTPGLKNFTHKGQMGGLDMRTTGGYIVGAPSTTPEGTYFWAQDGILPPQPPALLAACHQWSSQDNTVVLDAPDIPEDLPDYHDLGLDPKYVDYLDDGETGPWGHDESKAVFAVAGALQRRLQDPGLVYGIMSANDYVWSCAERHRPFGNVSEWLWKYGISKIVQQATLRSAADVFSPVPVHQQDSPVTPQAGEPHPFLVRGDYACDSARIAPEWVIRGLVERGQVGLVYGDSQALKSYLTLDMALTVSTGGDWHGHHVANPGPVWFLAGEGNVILRRRLEALRQRRGLHKDDLKHLWLTQAGLNLMDREHLQYLKDLVTVTGEPPRMLIVDTLSSNAVLDENNARDAAQLVSICYSIAIEWGTTVILVHHVGKGNSRSVRGSSVLQSNTDFRMRLERMPGAQRILTQLTVEKLKGAPEPRDPLVFEGKPCTIVGVLDEEMAPVSDLVLERVNDEAVKDEMQTAKQQARLTHRQANVFSVIKQIITNHWSFNSPGTGLLIEELRTEYNAHADAEGVIKPSRFMRDIEALVNRGLLRWEKINDCDVIHLKKATA